MVEDTSIFNLKDFFLIRTFLKKAKQDVKYGIGIILLIIYIKILLKDFSGLTNPVKTLTFYIYELLEVIIIDKYKNFIFATV